MTNNEFVSSLEDGVRRLLLFELWNDETKDSLKTYLTLRGVEEYIVSDPFTNNKMHILHICVKIDGDLHILRVV